MTEEFKNKISLWKIKATKAKDPWIIFVLYYFIFDAYLTHESQSGEDARKKRWFFDNNNSLKDSFSGCWKTELLPNVLALKSLSPIKDMRPGSITTVSLNDENNIEEIINFIYQIRCNLFHGSKDIMDSNDANLVFFGGEFLKNAIDWWLVSTK